MFLRQYKSANSQFERESTKKHCKKVKLFNNNNNKLYFNEQFIKTKYLFLY